MTVKVYEDKTLTCKKCGKPFVWKANDQRFFDQMVEKGTWQNASQPKKCSPCKAHEREVKSGTAA